MIELKENDIVLVEVPTHQRRLEYVKKDKKWGLSLSCNICPIVLIPENINQKGWRITKVGDTINNPEYMAGHDVMYLEKGDETDDGICKLPIIDEKNKQNIQQKIMSETATKLISFYNGETDGFPHVKDARWERGHLLVWLDPDYVQQFIDLFSYPYIAEGIKAVLCYGGVCIPEFEKIFEDFDINAEDVESKEEI